MSEKPEEISMRELTAYEKKKYLEDGQFNAPEHIYSNDEWGHMMEMLQALVEMGTSYGMSDEFMNVARVEYLDQYYDQLYYIYAGNWGYTTADSIGLPPLEDVQRRQERAIELGVEKSDAVRMALDWAVRWKDTHALDHFKQQRREALKQELAALGE